MIRILNELALHRQPYVKRMNGYSYVIFEYIIKCVVYQNTTQDLDKWIDIDICKKLEALDKTQCTSKIKYKDYLYQLFLIQGDAEVDMYTGIEYFQIKHTPEYNNKPIGKQFQTYPNFNLTDELVKIVFNIFLEFAKESSKMLADKPDYVSTDYADLFRTIYNVHMTGIDSNHFIKYT